MMPCVFISMPYGDHNAEHVRQANVQAAVATWDRLTDAGLLAYLPHLSHYLHWRHPRPREKWLELDCRWVARCDCILALGEPTEGMNIEIQRARLEGKPVFFSIDALASAYGLEI